MKHALVMVILIAASLLQAPTAIGQPPENPAQLNFQITGFKSVVQKYSVEGRGMVRLIGATYGDRLIGLRLRYTLRLKNEPFSYTSSSWVVVRNGSGLVETYASLPEIILNTLREEKDYPIFEWSVDGWFFMNPGTIVGG